jgi:hypothetical protein
MTSKKVEALEEIMKQLILGNETARKQREAKQKADQEYREKQQKVMEAILEGLQRRSPALEDKETERFGRRQALEAKRQQRLAAVEAELRAEFEEAGLEYAASVSASDVQQEYEEFRDREQPRRDRYTTERREYGTVQEWKSENVKVEHVGLIKPLPPHAEWTGQILEQGSSTVYVSFKGWLDHVEAVLSQKDTIQWKKAVLDCATLSCLRGRALDWWNALSPAQQWNLRNDYTLVQWRELAKPLFRNATLTRREARDRKRQRGETLSDYAWKKLAMLNEAYGRERPTLDVIADIKEGLSVSDQEKITTDLQRNPNLTRFMEELARLDSIRGPQFKESRSMTAPQPYRSRQDRGDQTRPRKDTKKTSLADTYDPKQLAFRQNPLTLSAAKQWSYVFPNGRTIFLSSPCSHCGAKHFNFECKKRDEHKNARAAMQFGEGWDEGGDYDSEEGEDFMEEACAAYTCVMPSAWMYYGETPEPGPNQNDSKPWDETRNLSGN